MRGLWFRVYIDIVNDLRYHSLSDAEFRLFFNLCAIAKKHDMAGYLPPIDGVLWVLRADPKVFQETLYGLEKAGFVVIDEKQNCFIKDWNLLQFSSDSDPTATLRKQRQREKLAGVTRDVTDESRGKSRPGHAGRHAPVTRTEKRILLNPESSPKGRKNKNNPNGLQKKALTEEVMKLGENELVRLTNTEYERYLERYGEAKLLSAIELLDGWILDKKKDPYGAPTHRQAMDRWVFAAVDEKAGRSNGAGKTR